MTSKSPARSAEDIDETALSYAEIKALCSGNPLIKEKMNLDTDVAKLKLLKSSFLSQRYALEDQVVKQFPREIAEAEQEIAGLKADAEWVKTNTTPDADGFSPMILEGKTYTDKKEAGSALLELAHNMKSPDPIQIGTYRGFSMTLSFEKISCSYVIDLAHKLKYQATLGSDLLGNIQRLDNAIARIETKLVNEERDLQDLHVQMEIAKKDLEKPFPQEAELMQKSARLSELNILLDLDHRENEIVDSDIADDSSSSRSSRDYAR